MAHVCQLIALSAIRYRSQIRRVGFDQQTLERNLPGHFLEFHGILERHDAGKLDVEAHVQGGTSHLERLGEAMHDAPDLVRAPRA
jgi:hypothetical protein